MATEGSHTVVWNPIDSCSASLSVNGWEIERRCTVFDCTSSTDMLINAVTAAGVSLGTVYGYSLTNCVCEEIHPQLRSGTQDIVDITYVYRQLVPSMETSLGTTLSQQDSCYDVNGNLVEVEYGDDSQKVIMPRLYAESTLRVSRIETSSPGAVSREYVGTVNDGSWSRDTGAAARTWLCLSITGQVRTGSYWLVTYEFAYRSNTWDEVVFYVDSTTGRIPGDATDDGYAIKTVQLYEEKDFDDFSLGS